MVLQMWQITDWCGKLLTDVANYYEVTDMANYWLTWRIIQLMWQFYEWRGKYMSDVPIISMTLRILDIYEWNEFASMEASCLMLKLPTLNCSAAPRRFRSAPSSKCPMKYFNHLRPERVINTPSSTPYDIGIQRAECWGLSGWMDYRSKCARTVGTHLPCVTADVINELL